MREPGTKNNPAVIKVQTAERAKELLGYCDSKGWILISGIEPYQRENIDDIKKLEKGLKPSLNLKQPL